VRSSIERLCAVSIALCLLTACPNTRKATAPAAVPMSIDLDDGALHVDRVASASTPISRQQAATDFVETYTKTSGPVVPIFGLVTTRVTPYRGQQHPPRNLKRALSWVYVGHQGDVVEHNCGPGYIPQSPAPGASKAWVVIIDAMTGKGYVYEGRGTQECAPLFQPELFGTARSLSVPWTFSGHELRVRVPPCGQYASAHFRARTVATAFVPIGPCRKKATVFVLDTGRARPQQHAALGVDCYGVSDPAFPRPSDCLPGNAS
jgi:hypothetical protein